MISKGTMDREDDAPPKFRATLSVRPEQEEAEPGDANAAAAALRISSSGAIDAMSEGSELMNESVVSSVVDKYGFLSAGAAADDQSVPPPRPTKIDVLRRRETKWLEMLGDWDAYMMRNYKKVRERCRKGIPTSLRARAWMKLCGACYYMNNPENKTEFKRLYNQRGNQKWIDDIEKDLHRNFPTHELFGGAYERIGQTELYRVLKAYSVLNPVDGYCQAMAPIAALLLMNMPAEQAFWCLVSICDKYIPGYYSPGMEAIQLDGDILFGLLRRVSPGVYKHLRRQGVEPILYMTEWFLCAYARTLPWPTVLRIWDMFMCEGVKVLFRVALVIIKATLTKSVRKRCPSMYETLDALKNLPANVTEEHFLVEQVVRLNVSEEVMEKEHRKQLKRRREEAANGRSSRATEAGSREAPSQLIS